MHKNLAILFLSVIIISAVAIPMVQKQSVYNAQMKAHDQRIYAAQLQIKEKYRKIEKQLQEAKNKANPTKHDLWLIQHLEKTFKLLHKAVNPAPVPKRPWMALQQMETVMMLLLMALGFFIYWLKSQKTDKEHPVEAGFSSTRFRSSTEHDRVAQRTHWQVIKSGGANFKTHTLTQKTADLLCINASSQMQIFYLLFIIIGFNNVLFSYIAFFQTHGLQPALSNPLLFLQPLFTVGLTFVLVGLLIRFFYGSANFRFDKSLQQLKMGKQSVSFSALHALQILEETVGGSDSAVFKSYELNLVLKDGHRIHLMDHGHYAAFNHDAEQLAAFLALPIWQAGSA
ncbi:MAG: hypothetical protein HRU20_26940 [Pseudomonadales bacterium]|nr:hypothetical protein [Pseudomonadales bacterium]